MNGGGEGILRRQPIVHGRGNVALLSQAQTQGIVSQARTGPEAAAVDAQHGRERSIALLGSSQVEFEMLAIRISKLDARLVNDTLGDGQLGGRMLRLAPLSEQQAGDYDANTRETHK